MIKAMDKKSLVELLNKRKKYLDAIEESYSPDDPRETLEEKALKVHTYRMIAELFGKADGYCLGVGGGMHIADFELGHLGANAIVGGYLPIATGAVISCRYQKQNSLALCLAGDGAYSNGVVLESLKKTGRAVVTSQEVTQSGYAAEIISQIQEEAFDWLDSPILRLSAPNGIPPSAQNLEKLFLPDSEKLVKKMRDNF
jgi:hypothetical protein